MGNFRRVIKNVMGKGTSNIVDKGLSQQNRRFEVTKPNNYCENLGKLI